MERTPQQETPPAPDSRIEVYKARIRERAIDGVSYEERKALWLEELAQLEQAFTPYLDVLPHEQQDLWRKFFAAEPNEFSLPSRPKVVAQELAVVLGWLILSLRKNFETIRHITLPNGEKVSLCEGKNSGDVYTAAFRIITEHIFFEGSIGGEDFVDLITSNLYKLRESLAEPSAFIAYTEWESDQRELLQWDNLVSRVQELFPDHPHIEEDIDLGGVQARFEKLLEQHARYQMLKVLLNKKYNTYDKIAQNPGALTAKILAFPHELLLRAAIVEELAVSKQTEFMESMSDFSVQQMPAQEVTQSQKDAVLAMADDFWTPRGIETPMDTLRAGLEDEKGINTFAIIEWAPTPERRAHFNNYGAPCFETQDGKILVGVFRLEEESAEQAYAGSLQLWKGARGFDLAHTIIMSTVHPLNEQDISVRVLCEVDGVAVDLTLEMGGIITEMYLAHELPEGSNVPGLYELHYPTVEQHRQYESMTIPDADFLQSAHFVNLRRANAYDERLEEDARNPFVGQFVRLWHEKDHKTVRTEGEGYVKSVTTFVPTEPRIISFACRSNEVDSSAFRKLMHELVHRQAFHVVRIIRKTREYGKLRGQQVDVFVLENIERTEDVAEDANFT